LSLCLREDFIVTIDRRSYTLWSLLRKLQKGRGRRLIYDCILGENPGSDSPRVHLACQRLKEGELLILATNSNAETASANDRKRWQIETLFAACKTRGFNLEDTHITRSMRIKKRIAVLAIAFCWAHKTAEWKACEQPIKLKNHGCKAQSIFRYGLDKLRQLLGSTPHKAILLLCTFIKIPSPTFRV